MTERTDEAFEIDRLADSLLRAREHCLRLDDHFAAGIVDILLLYVAQRLVACGFPPTDAPASPPPALSAPRRRPAGRAPSRGMRCPPRRR